MKSVLLLARELQNVMMIIERSSLQWRVQLWSMLMVECC